MKQVNCKRGSTLSSAERWHGAEVDEIALASDIRIILEFGTIKKQKST